MWATARRSCSPTSTTTSRRRPSPARPAFAPSTTRATGAAFFRHVAGYTERKLVFDLNPRQYRVEDVVADLQAAGLARVELHPFFFPQRHGLPGLAAAALRAAERSGLLARALLRVRFSYVVSASREG